MENPTEREIEKYLVDRIKAFGGLTYKFISPGAIGVPDRIVVLFKKLTFVELKTKAGRVSPIQKYQHDRLADHGFPVYVLRSKEEIDSFIRTLSLC